ncbi:MAG: undecaprenyldiphospho-muramoylpentapeptide beta-N-acetylglucosaminyltransferase [Acidobacteriia bacterium]|nr:undecaprenyldiphospho-muramoylpentapeptide beta-N-acetylglucosaminyltransferase [Terriglobia bacterium]
MRVKEGGRRIVVAGGGTGGHLFPALAVADELRRRHPDAIIAFIGGKRGLETRLVPAAGFRLRTMPLAGLKGASLPGRVAAAAAAAVGTIRCLAWMVAWRPDLVIGVGGYASGPAVLAARLLRVRAMVMEQNHFPGAVNRWLAPRVDAVCVPSDAARSRLGGRGIVTGNPVRREFTSIGPPPSGEALSLLVFGGSRGARSINRAAVGAIPSLGRISPPPRIVHQTGDEDEASVAAAYRDYPGSHEVRAFLDDMAARLAGADLAVCRAGATTLAELAAAGRPAVLVPYPFAADDHQRLNAEAVEDAGAAVVVLDRDLDGSRLAATVAALAADPARRRAMGEAARKLARPDAAERIADVADALLEGGAPGAGGPSAGEEAPDVP